MSNEELVRLIKQGDTALMADLYEQNKPIIHTIAKKQQRDVNEYDDAMQDAYFGLVAAVNAYDESMGYKFITYAIHHIKCAINRGKSSSQPIPEWLRIRVSKIKRAQRDLEQELKRTPTTAELSDRTGLSGDAIKRALRAVKPPKSIYDDIADDLTIADTIADESIDFEYDIAEADEQRQLHAVVDELPERERQMIRLHYFEGMTYADIGRRLNVTGTCVGNVICKAIKYLRKPKFMKMLIDEEIDTQTSFYQHKGVKSFKTSWTSSTEDIVLQRADKMSRFIEKLTMLQT